MLVKLSAHRRFDANDALLKPLPHLHRALTVGACFVHLWRVRSQPFSGVRGGSWQKGLRLRCIGGRWSFADLCSQLRQRQRPGAYLDAGVELCRRRAECQPPQAPSKQPAYESCRWQPAEQLPKKAAESGWPLRILEHCVDPPIVSCVDSYAQRSAQTNRYPARVALPSHWPPHCDAPIVSPHCWQLSPWKPHWRTHRATGSVRRRLCASKRETA
jgi:hypothetical protein